MRLGPYYLLSFTLACHFIVASPGRAQNTLPPGPPPDATLLSPEAAYAEALHPLEVTRHDISNWSDAELASMTVAIRKASDACQARKSTDYAGVSLVDLARLCALGQQWTSVIEAAKRFIAAGPNQPKPLLTDAYTAKIEAHLHLNQESEVLQDALALLTAAPYSSETADCIDEALDYMRFVHTADALKLAQARQPLILAALRATSAAGIGTKPTQPAPETPSASTLYRNGLALAVLQQLAAHLDEAHATVVALDTALPATVSSDDNIRIVGQRRRYALLGKPLTGIAPLSSLSSPVNKLPEIPAHNTLTALLLFPDWCAQCIRMGPRLPETVFKVEGHSAYLYAALAETVPPRKVDPTITNVAFSPAYAASMLSETPTVTVSPETLNHFFATEFPLLLIADPNGILRVLQPITPQDLQPGGEVDSAIALIGKNFPLKSTALVVHTTTPGNPR